MKKVFNYIRSMRFGILLLALIAVCSVAGTVIPQGREIAFYAQTYRSFHGVLLVLQLHNIFESWYFVARLALLCLNLSLCSILRIRTVVRGAKTETERAAKMPDTMALTPEGVALAREHLEAMRCRQEAVGDAVIYRKHSLGLPSIPPRWRTATACPASRSSCRTAPRSMSRTSASTTRPAGSTT